MSDTQGIEAPNCAHKQLKKQMVGEQCWYACECGQKFRVELWDGKVSVLAPLDPRKDLAARLEEFTPWVIQHADVCTYVASDEGPLCDCGYSERRLKWETLLAEMRGAKR